VVGKRCAISGVPNFLDNTLQPWREKLAHAAKGHGALEEALEARAIKEILSLSVAGKGRVEEIRKLYPFGMSADVMKSILADTRLALHQTTLVTRAVIATLCGLLGIGLFYAVFFTGFEAEHTVRWTRTNSFALDVAILGAALGCAWALLNLATFVALRRRFPQLHLAYAQKIGKTGYCMLGGIAMAFAAIIAIAPLKPLWLAALLR